MDSNTETKIISWLQNRRDICNSCDKLTTYVGIKACSECGCAVWSKTMLRGQKCPLGKWNAEQD